MSIDSKDIRVGNRYLCVFPNDNILRDYLVVEISTRNLQDKIYVRLKHEDENSGIPVSKWVVLNVLSGSVIEKLEKKDENEDYMDLPLIGTEISTDERFQNFEDKRKESVDQLQDFIKLQTEYLTMLMKEKKNTDDWKE